MSLRPVESNVKFGWVPSNWNLKSARVFRAIKYGDSKTVTRLLDEEPQIIQAADSHGNTILHWSCRWNSLEALIYLQNFKINSEILNFLGQKPIHVACSHRSFEATIILLKAVGNVSSVDGDLCTPLHYAAKAGDSESALILLLNEADAAALDFRQCTPLHFAASSGNANLCSLLLRFYLPAISIQDGRGNTPLHLSCCKGKFASTSAMLHSIFRSFPGFRLRTDCQSLELFMHPYDVSLGIRNNEGSSAEDMAACSGYYELAELVRYYKHKHQAGKNVPSERSSRIFQLRNLLLGPPGRRRALFAFMLFVSFGWMYPYLWFRVRKTDVRLSPQHEFLFFVVNCILWACFFKEYVADPGYLPQNTSEYESAMQEILLESRELAATSFPWVEDADGRPQLCPFGLRAFKKRARTLKQKAQRLCHTCGCVKPLRAKHCGQCNRCVDVMDHHCPVTNNCVGKNNRVWFLLTGLFVLITTSVIGYLSVAAWYWSPKTRFCDIFTWILLFSGWTSALNASIGTLSRALFNVTTNELVNWPRYAHFRGKGNSFHNPFDKGFRDNLAEFFRPGSTVLEEMPTADEDTKQETSYPLVV